MICFHFCFLVVEGRDIVLPIVFIYGSKGNMAANNFCLCAKRSLSCPSLAFQKKRTGIEKEREETWTLGRPFSFLVLFIDLRILKGREP